MTTFFLGRSYKYAFSADRETMIDQSMNTTKVQFGELMSFIGINYGDMSEGVAYRSRHDSKTSASLQSTIIGDRSRKLGT